jgi:peptidoglycan/LPS O-acetylase OafA/YrhL
MLILVLALLPALTSSRFFFMVLLFPLTALGMFAILFGASLLPTGGLRLLESRWLARAGRIAYPWYLTHVLVLHWSWAEMRAGILQLDGLGPARQFALYFPVYFGASIAVALMLHFLIEKPCLLLKDSIGRPRGRANETPFTAQTA